MSIRQAERRKGAREGERGGDIPVLRAAALERRAAVQQRGVVAGVVGAVVAVVLAVEMDVLAFA